MATLALDLRAFLPRLLEKDFRKRLTAVAAMDSLWITRA
jgi:serine/threonine protein kinase